MADPPFLRVPGSAERAELLTTALLNDVNQVRLWPMVSPAAPRGCDRPQFMNLCLRSDGLVIEHVVPPHGPGSLSSISSHALPPDGGRHIWY